MIPLNKLQGSIVALVTPFTTSGEIDYLSLETLLQLHLLNDTDAIVISGTTGESPAFSLD